ncbi:hypothetical protein PHYSODRAFT_285276 [Phytophthora sojae]|uniref:RxLR effector protein n=1 Tax=Phytophthora sojae (strain P6497) TaxID=1094619 RepID=G4Z4A4_PHYSP|nr:hypothetical protein PHYSODRAFT_285276 [Phytophthora sojae]EGZ19410.1 hypothetical protein PHYSODRAFT_285276 [Phytophthora sojae]|eukprot:XP_009522127.1 hypothetical protein PHYSODRAFT_285276 [Phytophthora sojae]
MAKWGIFVILWMALLASISADHDPRMRRAEVVVRKANSSSSGSFDQELTSPGELTRAISKLKDHIRCFKSLFNAEKCIILATKPS